MEEKKYTYQASHRPDGFYAVVLDERTNEKVFEQKCDSLEDAKDISLLEFHRLNDK